MKTFTLAAYGSKPCVASFEVKAENEDEAMKKAKECIPDNLDWDFDLETVGLDASSIEFAIIDIEEFEPEE
jgi:hypothetical protein